MAALGREKTITGVRYYVKLSPGENAQRPKIHLGLVNRKQAAMAKGFIESLIASKKGASMPLSTQEWLKGIPDSLRSRLEILGLVERSAKNRWTVSAWVASYIDQRPDVKEATRRKWKDVQEKLNVFFKDDPIGDVTQKHAKNFRIYLQTTVELSENTIRRHIGIARQFFNAAIEAEIITKNPFRGQPVSVRTNASRFFYVSPEIAQAVLAACPDAEWRLIFGLARFGGLRCPSEILRLKWQDIDFEKSRFTVHASKTEHHADSGIRVVPMFPELKPLFLDAYASAKDGAVYCIESYRGTETNLRTQFKRILAQAGIEDWPKLFQNCRSTRETELFKLTRGNVKAVCSWLGNSPAVALQHYAQTTEADLKDAATMTLLNTAEQTIQEQDGTEGKKEGHNQGHSTTETGRNEVKPNSNESSITPCDCEGLQSISEPCENRTKDIHWAIQDSNLRPAD